MLAKKLRQEGPRRWIRFDRQQRGERGTRALGILDDGPGHPKPFGHWERLVGKDEGVERVGVSERMLDQGRKRTSPSAIRTSNTWIASLHGPSIPQRFLVV